MIINIRGTSGSGKTHLARQIMSCYKTRVAIFKKIPDEGKTRPRKQPICYWHSRADGGRKLVVPGHYETACGGCDTISSLDEVFGIVEAAAENGDDVMFEGLLMSADVNRVAALASKHHVKVIALDVPLETCLESVNGRRRARMGDKFTPVNPANTASKHRGVQLSVTRLQNLGVDANFYTREAALDTIKRELDL